MLKQSIIFTNVMIGRIYMHPPIFSGKTEPEPALFPCCIRIPSLGDASGHVSGKRHSPVFTMNSYCGYSNMILSSGSQTWPAAKSSS